MARRDPVPLRACRSRPGLPCVRSRGVRCPGSRRARGTWSASAWTPARAGGCWRPSVGRRSRRPTSGRSVSSSVPRCHWNRDDSGRAHWGRGDWGRGDSGWADLERSASTSPSVSWKRVTELQIWPVVGRWGRGAPRCFSRRSVPRSRHPIMQPPTPLSAGSTGPARADRRSASPPGSSKSSAGWTTRRCAVFEVHPELSFAVLMGAVPKDSKRTWSGAVSRWRALRGAGLDLSRIDSSTTGPAGVDDVLDAIAIAWSARRAAAGEAHSYPDPPEVLPSGRLMAIRA